MNSLTKLFVRNEGPAPAAPSAPAVNAAKAIQKFTVNLLPKLVRHDTMEGRDHLVIPMVILTEGVHNGSEGPLYYPPEELGKTPMVWNHKPLVVYHPEIDGKGVSACDPVILTARKVGVMMNTKFEGGRLKSEAWIEPDRANAIDKRVLEAVQNNEMMEVSTGVFVDAEMKTGEWNKETYSGIARNYRPDHLAILPDMVGACSIADGAGLLRNQEDPKKKRHPGASALRKVFDSMMSQMGITQNEMSFDNTRENLCRALGEKLGTTGANYMGPWPYVADVYSNFFIYEYDGKLWRLGYTAADTGITLSEDKPVEVQRVTEYRTVNGATFVGNQNQNADPVMNKKQIIDGLIANSSGNLTEADRARLEVFSEEQLKKITFGAVPATNTAPVPAPVAVAAPVATVPPVTANSTASKVVTVKDYIDAAPREVAQVLNHSLDIYNEEKAKLVAGIMAVKNNTFKKEDLEQRAMAELRQLSALAGVNTATETRRADYSGQGSGAITDNANTEEVLALPVMNFTKEQPAAK